MRSKRVFEHNKKYQCGLSDDRIEEMASKTGSDPYKVAQSFGGPTPRVVRTYSRNDLLNALIEGHEHKDNAQELHDHFVGKAEAMKKAFGVDTSKLPRLLTTTIDRMVKLYGPFGVYLAGSPGIFEQRMRDMHFSKIGNAIFDLKKTLRALASDIMDTVYYEYDDIRESIDSDGLLAAGFDDDFYPPDPDDFW